MHRKFELGRIYALHLSTFTAKESAGIAYFLCTKISYDFMIFYDEVSDTWINSDFNGNLIFRKNPFEFLVSSYYEMLP